MRQIAKRPENKQLAKIIALLEEHGYREGDFRENPNWWDIQYHADHGDISDDYYNLLIRPSYGLYDDRFNKDNLPVYQVIIGDEYWLGFDTEVRVYKRGGNWKGIKWATPKLQELADELALEYVREVLRVTKAMPRD